MSARVVGSISTRGMNCFHFSGVRKKRGVEFSVQYIENLVESGERSVSALGALPSLV